MGRFAMLWLLVMVLQSPQSVAADKKVECLDYDVFVMRHLQKDDVGGKDPSLSQEGQSNALELAGHPAVQKVSHGFYTPFKRTFETLQGLDIDKSVYQPMDYEALAHTIKSQYCDESVIVVGHSNTVSSLINALGGKFVVSYAGHKLQYNPQVMLDENDYGSIYRLTYHNERIHQQLYQLGTKHRQSAE